MTATTALPCSRIPPTPPLSHQSSVLDCPTFSSVQTDTANSSLKRPPTPPSSSDAEGSVRASALKTGLSVLLAERDGLAHLHDVYATHEVAQRGFEDATEIVARAIRRSGKLVISGVGKSGKIGLKLVATMNSLGVSCIWMHPTEALHGDLGMIGRNDVLMLITYSGKTTELISLLPYLPHRLPLLVMTAHLDPSKLPLFTLRPQPDNRPPCTNILLPATTPSSETELFGVPAPTVSTTVSLALGDALAMAIARSLHTHDKVGKVFAKYHPGGAIGAAARLEEEAKTRSAKPVLNEKSAEVEVTMDELGSSCDEALDQIPALPNRQTLALKRLDGLLQIAKDEQESG